MSMRRLTRRKKRKKKKKNPRSKRRSFPTPRPTSYPRPVPSPSTFALGWSAIDGLVFSCLFFIAAVGCNQISPCVTWVVLFHVYR